MNIHNSKEITLSSEEWAQLGMMETAACYILDRGEPGYKECTRLCKLGLAQSRKKMHIRGDIFTLTEKGEELLKM